MQVICCLIEIITKTWDFNPSDLYECLTLSRETPTQVPSSTGVEPANGGLCVRVPRFSLKAAACFWQAPPQTRVKNGNVPIYVRLSHFLARLNFILLRTKKTADKEKFLTPRFYSPHWS